MQHDWIIDVLADLKHYADRHRLSDLSRQLQATAAVARRAGTPAGAGPGKQAPLTNHPTHRVGARAGPD